ncbi:MAG: hypothetical protein U1A27_12770 [Phycisphaerae bacterium]
MARPAASAARSPARPASPAARSGRPFAWRAWLGPIAVATVAWLAYSPTLRGGFVNWDDPANVIDNLQVRGLDAARLAWMWRTRHLGVWEPLAWMLKGTIVAVAGVRPFPFHLVSLLLHGLNAALVCILARRLLARAACAERRADLAAALAAAVFALHPLHVECVAWVSGQPYLLAGAFLLAALIVYLPASADRPATIARRGAAAALFAAAVLSKIAAAPGALLFLLLDLHPLGRLARTATEPRGRVLIEKLAFLLPAAAAATYVALAPTIGALPAESGGAGARLVAAAAGLATQSWHVVAPLALSPFYPARGAATLPARETLIGGLLLIALCAAALRWRRRPGLSVAVAGLLLMLLPAAGLVRHGDQLIADRYGYLSMIGLAIVAGAAAARQRVARTAALLIVAAWGVLAWRQCGMWHDSHALWQHALAVDGRNWLAHNNLANADLERGDAEAALAGANRALAIRDDYADAWFTRGLAFERLGRPDAAAAYERAVQLVPAHVAALNLGALRQRAGQRAAAEAIYDAALAANPGNADAAVNRALLCFERRQFERAGRLIDDALARDSFHARAWLVRGQLQMVASDWPAADASLSRAVELSPALAEAFYQRAYVRARQRDAVAAEADYRRCIALRADHVDARVGLSELLAAVGSEADAIRALESAAAIAPQDVRVANRLAFRLATAADAALRDPKRAVELATQLCVRLRYENAQTLDTLAIAQAAAGLYEAAVASAERAVALARRRGRNELAAQIESRLGYYRRGQPAPVGEAAASSGPASAAADGAPAD